MTEFFGKSGAVDEPTLQALMLNGGVLPLDLPDARTYEWIEALRHGH